MNVNLSRAVVAGLAGTAAMTLVMQMAPAMGVPPMNVGAMLGSVMGGIVALGWVAHFMIGVVLAGGYAVFFSSRLPGPPFLRGAIFSLLPWLMAQLVVMPMMGMGFFSGSIPAAGGSLMAHLAFGAVMGQLYGNPGCSATTARHAHA